MTSSTTYHEKIKNEQHVFLFSVVGRSSSTAFQRIINSSNKVWMWGEPQGVINHAISMINHMKHVRDSDLVKFSLTNMYNSYNDNKHLVSYPSAIGNLDTSAELINATISNILKPWAPKVKRFGFKEIELTPVQTFDHLREIYPQSYFIFGFRNPLTQWPSVCKLDWPISKDLKLFLNKYSKIATYYIEFAKTHNINAFIENNDLRDIDKVNEIIKYLNIPAIDVSLIDVTIHSLKGEKLTPEEVETILSSTAYEKYLEMQKISESFYKTNLNCS